MQKMNTHLWMEYKDGETVWINLSEVTVVPLDYLGNVTVRGNDYEISIKKRQTVKTFEDGTKIVKNGLQHWGYGTPE